MSNREIEETQDLWNRVADDWLIQVGDDGDANRRLNSYQIRLSKTSYFLARAGGL